MKVESNSNFGTAFSFWKSLSLASLSASAMSSFWLFVMVCFALGHTSDFILGVLAEFLIMFSLVTFLCVWVGHFAYFNFDWDFRRKCVVCGSKCYVSSMSKFFDSESLETVFMCDKHKIVGVN